MATLQELKDAVAALTAEAKDAGAKNDVLVDKVGALITLTDTIKDQLVLLTEAGQMSPEVLSGLTTAINDSITAVHAIGVKAADEGANVDAATARDADASTADASGTLPADGSAPTGGGSDGPPDSAPVEKTTETP